ncbi:MAG: 1-(5-phosphoribosyl)-5-[(5-phosphoribosylamino)methylideneamino]imidazole-4-carboxamide isomerase [Negativicutes bacterium]
MIIFPAIDLRGGKCVRLFKGDFSRETIFSDNPSAVAVKWEEMGAQYLHVVDLDGALQGETKNREAIRSILGAVHIPMELGGGLRSLESIERALTGGIQRVILGSAAVENPLLVQEACHRFGDRIVVAIDARDGIVATQGWESSGNVSALDFAKQMADYGVKTVIYTDISRDGTLSGLNLEGAIELSKVSGLRVVASGGVRSLEDIRAVKAHETDGIEGVIVGQAIYSGRLDLKKALRIAAEG